MIASSFASAWLLAAAVAAPVTIPFHKTAVWVDDDAQAFKPYSAQHPGGEAQSAVVRPGLKSQCMKGRVLVSNDAYRGDSANKAIGLVSGRDIGGADTKHATFEPTPTPANYGYGTNDHDLIVLKNGDVLYATGAFTKAPLDPKPVWFDVTWRGDFGPGARSNVLVWKSIDCGETFQFLSEMDPARFEDGTCANPQPVASPTPGHRFDMGGSDGQLIHYDAATDTLYLTFQCVGHEVDLVDPKIVAPTLGHAQKKVPVLGAPLDKTLFLSSHHGGAWTSLGWIDKFSGWRMGIVPLGQPGTAEHAGSMAIGAWGYLRFAERKLTPLAAHGGGVGPLHKGAGPGGPVQAIGMNVSYAWEPPQYLNYDWGFDFAYLPDPCDAACHTKTDATWNARPETSILATAGHVNADLSPSALIYGNILANMLVVRGHDAHSVYVLVPARIGKSDGFRVHSVERATGVATELASIAPTVPDANHFVMRAVAIDSGPGPLFVYWMDVDAKGKTATIRGRFLYAGATPGSSADLVVAKSAGAPRQIALDKVGAGLGLPLWYGDYNTAGGFETASSTPTATVTDRSYFPLWVEPDGSLHYTAVHQRDSMMSLPVPTQKLVTLHDLPNGKTVKLQTMAPGKFKLPESVDRWRRTISDDRPGPHARVRKPAAQH